MNKETAYGLSNMLLVAAILMILAVCGNCCLSSQNGTYGPEEFYSKGDGTAGYGAKYFTNSPNRTMLVAVVGGTLICTLFGFSAYYRKKAEKLPSGGIKKNGFKR